MTISSAIVSTLLLGLSRLHSVLSLSTVSSVNRNPAASPWIQVEEIKAAESNDASPVHKREWTKTAATTPWWSGADDYLQEATFIPSLWGLRGVPRPEIPEATTGDDHVRFFVYEIGGPLTKVLSASVSKDLPLIPHVGVRIRGTEWFFSDHVESRKSGVMEKMLSRDAYPQCQFDLGPTKRSNEEIAEWLTESQSRYNKETYVLWTNNCNHFAREFAEFLRPDGKTVGIPKCLMDPILDVTDNMLDNLPEWRRKAGNTFMDTFARFVVVSWGSVVKQEKDRIKKELEEGNS